MVDGATEHGEISLTLKQNKMVETITGIVVAVGLIFLTMALNKYFTTKLIAAAILIAIAFIYVGFALKDNTIPFMILEISIAIVFFFLAIIGYSYRASLLGYGIILHGIWDVLHHNSWFLNTDVPVYWPLFCLTIDLIYGIYILSQRSFPDRVH